MDDAEAEAVLLALGPQLEWHEATRQEEVWYAWIGGETYSAQKGIARKLTISVKKPFLFYPPAYHVWFVKTEVYEPHIGIDYKTEDAAKAACERHHATGKWK